ncbi:DUF7933 domain-containing protein [Mangrovimonas aestuarii]|uniref:DUF7933 domain-containing protein n=1 Tax=Mangrovimonas aestuarii TaxID=3018443 RepID=UPI00237890C8|nr:gliding motility-associated C-terminal domain-containing protein [Mangrovimonas aestuarii]
MLKKITFLSTFFACFLISKISAQTCDLSILVEAQDISGTAVSQVHINQEFQYIITIINSGNAVTGVTFSQSFDTDVQVISYQSQNNLAGASDVTNFESTTGVLSGSVDNMPQGSSVQVKLIGKAPLEVGAIGTSVEVFTPEGLTDTNPSNNISVISMGVIDALIDFSVTYSQILPSEGTGIVNWGDIITYEFTITNNSIIDFPLNSFEGKMESLQLSYYGKPVVQALNLTCVSGSNGMDCNIVDPMDFGFTIVNGTETTFTYNFNATTEFVSGGSLTYQVDYQFLQASCAEELTPLSVDSYIELDLDHENESSNSSNSVMTQLLESELCDTTDLCIETIQINPEVDTPIDWEEVVSFQTTYCNAGSSDALSRFYVQNYTAGNTWEIISLQCSSTTGTVTCDDFLLSDEGYFWKSTDFVMPANSTVTVDWTVKFYEPECSSDNVSPVVVQLRSNTNLLDTQLVDDNPANNFEDDFLLLPPISSPCELETPEVTISKTQISPMLPEGSSEDNTTDWGEIVYEINVQNTSDDDLQLSLRDFMPSGENELASASLVSVECSDVTGTATCPTIIDMNIGVVQDGEPEDDEEDYFWQIGEEDNWMLSAQSSVTFLVTIEWFPECSFEPIDVVNAASFEIVDPNYTGDFTSGYTEEKSYFAPCVDLVVQTYPEVNPVNVGETLNWVIDIANSETSSNAFDITFTDTLADVFVINGSPICTVISGNASCLNNIEVNGNVVTANIAEMDAGAAIQIKIPVIAPAFGGAFTNMVEAIPNPLINEEVSPITNLSISNLQVISAKVEKVFTPDIISANTESVLTFTITNVDSNEAQSNINFTDNLPEGIVLTGQPFWTESNGCTCEFVGNAGDGFVGVSNLSIPNGISSCSFAVPVSASVEGLYINDVNNFSSLNNIDSSQAYATLEILADNSNVDIAVLKTVSPQEVALGEEVVFTIIATNNGTTSGTSIEILEQMPEGYQIVNHEASSGVYNEGIGIWAIDELMAGQSETLILTAQVISSTDLLNIAILDGLNEVDRDPENNSDSAEVELNNCLQVPQAITPNNDGFNDVLVIPCITEYPETTLRVYNRYGNLVYETFDYANNWNGKPNQGFPKKDNFLPVGTYFYELVINGISSPVVGWVYLNY